MSDFGPISPYVGRGLTIVVEEIFKSGIYFLSSVIPGEKLFRLRLKIDNLICITPKIPYGISFTSFNVSLFNKYVGLYMKKLVNSGFIFICK